MSVEKLYKAVKSGQIHPSKLNDEGKQALKQYITIKQGLPVAQAKPKPNLLQRAGETVKSLIPSKETRDSISHTLFPAALSGKEGGLIENAIKNEQALRSRQNLGKGEAFLSGVRSGAMFGAGADEIRANNPQASGWVTGGEIAGALIPSIGLYGGTIKAGQVVTKIPKIGQALAKASPLAKIGATGFVSEGAYGLGHGLLEGERGADLAKTTAMYGAIGGVADVTLTKVIGPAISKVLQKFKGKPVATEVVEREVAKNIGVNWDNMNDTQKKAIREKIIAEMQKDPIQSGRALNVGQEFTMRDVTPQDRLKQVLPEGPLALPQPKQNFTLEPEPFKKQIPKVDFERPRVTPEVKPRTETFGNTTFEIGQKPGTPIEARDFENVGDRSIKAISFENPQIRPYYQYEAQNLLGEMQYAVPGKRTVAYNEFDEMVFTGQKKSVSDSIETIQAITGASYKEIEKGLQDIIHDKGRENNALSKRIELIIDENLSSGYKAFDGRQVPPNQDYLAAKKSLYLQPKLVQSQANPIDKTFHSQYNSEAEIRKQLAKYYSGFGQEGLDEATGAIADLQRTESQIRNRRKQELGGPSSLSGRKAGGIQDKPYKTVGLSFSRNLIDTGKVNLTGHKFNSVDELATVAQVFRDPRFETFRKIYTRGNQIVGTEAVSSRMPRVSVSFLGDADTHIKKQAEKMKRLGADGYYLLHNHPSGNPVPSKEDIVLTQHFANMLDGFKGHIIINSNKYTELYPVDTGGIVRIGGKENIPLNLGDDLLLSPSINNGLLGARVNSTEILAGMAKAIQMDENMSVLFFADAKLDIKGIQEVSNKMFNDVNFSGFLRNQAREHGGSSVFIVGDSSIQKQVENLVQHGFVTDAYMKDIGVNLRDNVPFIQRGDWMGLDARQQGRMIRPPKPIEDAPILRNERQLRLNAPQNFELKDPIYKKQIPREFDKTPIPTELPDWITPEPARFKKTIEVPARKLQPDLTPPLIKAETAKQVDLTPPPIEATQRVVQPDILGNADTFRDKINRNTTPKKRTFAETFERIRTQFIDDLAPLEGLEKRVRGTIASAEDSLYKQARLFRGIPEKAYNTIETQLKPIINSIEKQGYSYQDLGDYALAVHAKDVNARGINSGFTDVEINAVLQKYANTPLEEARKQLNRVSDNMLKELVDSEVITKEMYQALKEKWPNYMPLFRSFDDSKVDFATGLSKALANATSPIKRLEGSSRDVIDPIESMIKNIFNITNTSQRNRVGLQLAKLADEDTAGLIRRLSPNEDVGRKNVVSVLQNGEKVRYEVEPEVYKALLNLNREGSNLLMKILAKPASLLRAGATLTPEFSLRNPIRDIPFAFTVSKSKLNPLTDIPISLIDVITKGKYGGKYYNDWLQDMGGYGNIISMDRKVHEKALKDVLTQPISKKFVNILNPQSYLNLLRTIADVSESATKLGEYRAARRQGVSRAEAAYRSRDIMDFARAGSSTREANKIIAFLNANVQGKSKLWRALQENPTGVVTRATASVTLPTIALYAANQKFANEKQKETIKDAPDWLRNTFWLVAVPGTDQVARIPKPFDLAPIFSNFYERLLDRVVEDDPKAFDDFIRTTLGEESISVIPTALLPIIEGMSNKSFFRDAPIIPQREEGLRYQDQYDINTSETAKLIGKGIDNLTGGEGSFKNFGSPRIIDNTIRGYTAGLGTFALSALDVIFEGLGEVEKPDKPTKQFSQLPVARAFFVNPSSTGKSVDYVYTELDKLRRERGSANQGKGMFFEEGKYKFLNERASRISEVSKEIRNVTNHPTMSGDEKRKQLEKLNELRNRIARDTKNRIEKGN